MDQHVRATADALAAAYPAWPPEVRCLDLAEEVGELARAVLTAEGHKATPAARREDVGDALCGVLLDVFALADHYRIDLDHLYPTMLARLASTTTGHSRGRISPTDQRAPR